MTLPAAALYASGKRGAYFLFFHPLCAKRREGRRRSPECCREGELTLQAIKQFITVRLHI